MVKQHGGKKQAGYQFLDRPSHPASSSVLLNNKPKKEVTTSAKTVWEQVLAQDIKVSTTGIILYDQSGDPMNWQDNSMEDNILWRKTQA